MDDLIIVGIKSGKLPRFEGVDLHKACLRAGLRRTEAQVYQRFPLDETDTPLFSLVNGVEPGTFECDANAIDTPMVFLFTELPKQTDPVFAVNEMISGHVRLREILVVLSLIKQEHLFLRNGSILPGLRRVIRRCYAHDNRSQNSDPSTNP